MDCLVAKFFLNSCFSDTVFVTLLRTAVETAISEVHKLLGIGGVPMLLLNIVLSLAVADGLFGLCGSERLDELFISTPPPSPLSFPVPNKPYGFCGPRKKKEEGEGLGLMLGVSFDMCVATGRECIFRALGWRGCVLAVRGLHYFTPVSFPR